MVKRANAPETGQSEIVELNADARWQARLEEARARRAEALKRQGREDRPQRAPRKPWEDETDTSIAAEKHQRALDHTGLDFHDRMNALHKVMKETRPHKDDDSLRDATPLAEKPGRNWSPDAVQEPAVAPKALDPVSAPPVRTPEHTGPPVDSFFDELSLAPADPDPEPDHDLQSVPISDLVQPIAPRAQRVDARPWLKAAEEDEIERASSPVAENITQSAASSRKGMPFMLGVGLVALVAVPFFNLLPPMDRGPAPAVSPTFGMQPALGITAAMAEWPVATQSGEFVPTSSVAPRGPFVLGDTTPPLFSRVVATLSVAPVADVFVMPNVKRAGDPEVPTIARSSLHDLVITQAMAETQRGAGIEAGPLPGVLAPVAASRLIPASRP